MKFIEVTENYVKVRIMLRDILYAEVYNKSCLIHTSSGVVNTYLTISKLIELLDSGTFLRCHHSYVVNLDRVKAQRGFEFILDNGEHALISRRMKPGVQKAYNEFILEKDKEFKETDSDDSLQTKEIRVFISSPLPAFDEELNELGLFISNLNSRYSRGGVYFSLYVSGEGGQAEDIEAAKQSDLFYLIYHDKLDDRALAELEAARYALVRNGAPKIIAYGRKPAVTQANDLYSSQYTHIDTIKLSIVLQLRLLGLEYTKLDFDGTSLMLEGKALMSLDNIPVMFNSKSFTAMKNEYTELEKEYWELRERIRKDPDDEAALTAYLNISGRKNSIGEAMHGLQRDIIAMETSFLEKVGSGYITPRLVQARQLFENGDLEGARKLFDLDEMVREDELDEELLEETQKKIQAKVSEYLYLADMLKTDVNDPGRFVTIERIYEQAVRIEEKFNLSERIAVWKYVDHLYYQNEYEKAAELARRQLHLLETGKTEETEIAKFSHFISRCCNRLHNYEEAEEMSKKALLIRERLAAEDSAFEHDLAKSLDGLARILEITERQEEGEKLRLQALSIYERLAAENAAFLPDLAKEYNNLSELYVEIQRYKETEELCKKALDIHERLAEETPDVYDADLARSYAELAFVCNVLGRYDEAESLYIKAQDLREKLASVNPAAFDPEVAAGYIYMSKVYDKTKNWAAGEVILTKALAVTERLAVTHPDAYEFMLLANLSNLARVFEANSNYAQAEKMFKRALELSKNPTGAENNPAYTAIISYNLAALLEKTGQYDESEKMHKSSLELYEQLAAITPATFEPDLGKGYNGLARLYKVMGRSDEAKVLYEKALGIRERLAAENPEVFGEDLEETRGELEGLQKQ